MRKLLLATLLLTGCGRNLDGPCPDPKGIYTVENPDAPAVIINSQPADLVLDGQGFEALAEGIKNGSVQIPEVELALGDRSTGLEVTYVDDGELLLFLGPQEPLLEPGLYDLIITNPSGCRERLPEAVEVRNSIVDENIVIEEIVPPFGWTEEQTAVTIRGSGFVSTPRAWLSTGDFLRDFELEQVAFIDEGSLTAVVPAGLPVGGPYDLVVENPGSGFNALAEAFTVTEEAPPDIFTVLPEAGDTQDDTPVVITGENFDPGVEVWLYDIDGNEVQAIVDASASSEIQATFPSAGGMGVGAWIVRAVNEDGTWDEHAAFVVRNPSAKLGTDGAWTESEPLNVARAGLGVAEHIDDLGRGFLYAVGGSDGSASLGSVERAATDAFGTLASWELLGAQMLTPRAHGAVVEHDGWVYAIGGDDGAGPIDTVERARILTGASDVRPTIESATVEEGAGTLTAGTWYYRVSAVMDAGDAENPGGETPASGSYVVRIDTDDSAVTLEWSSVVGATHYRVYRTDQANGAAGEEHRIADDITATSLTDDGLAPGTEPYVPEGALGEWQELQDRIPSPWAHGAAVKATDPDGDTYLYLTGGTDGSASLTDILTFDLADGTWFTAGAISTPRIDNMAAAAGERQANELGAGSPVYLIILDGNVGGDTTNDEVYAPILAGGTLGGFSSLDRTNNAGQARMDGVGLAAAGHLYILGGADTPTGADTSGRQASIEGPDMAMGAWSSTSASGTFAVPRADFGLSQLRATLYAIGGRTDVDAATTSVEQVVF